MQVASGCDGPELRGLFTGSCVCMVQAWVIIHTEACREAPFVSLPWNAAATRQAPQPKTQIWPVGSHRLPQCTAFLYGAQAQNRIS